MSTPNPHIAIVGGGPAGLTLGLLLHKHSIPFTIFELRQRPTDEEFAQPSGSLDLHEESGLAAVKACDLFDEAMSLMGDCTEETKIADKEGNILYQDAGGLDRPEIYRHDLTKLFISHLPADSIQWGHKLVGSKRIASSEIELDFGKDGKHTFSFVVGADGAWSRVRPLLTDVKPHYAGFHNITISIRQITTKHPELLALVGHGTFYSLANKHGVFSQRARHDSARMYIIISAEDKDFATSSGLASKTPSQAKDVLLGDGAVLSQWGELIRQLVSVACEDETAHNGGACVDIKPLYALPDGHSWEHCADATLIGDAAHLTNPPAGEGVNIAMLDALLLSRAIVKAHEVAGGNLDAFVTALDSPVRDFEADMAGRAMALAEMTRMISGMMYGSEDGSRAMADWFEEMMRGSVGVEG